MTDFKGHFGSSRAGLPIEPARGHRGSNRTQLPDTSILPPSNEGAKQEVPLASEQKPGKEQKEANKPKKSNKGKPKG